MYKEVWEKIMNAKSIVLVSHIHPDGDTLGSSLGLYSVLKGLGKRVSLFNATKNELPREFDFLEGYSKIQNKFPKFFDLIIGCDSASIDRLGIEKTSCTLINIDHHKSNTNFGDYNIVIPTASSAGMVVYKFLKSNNIKIPKVSAVALYTSIVEDTNFFRYGGVDASTLDAASDLLKCGANPELIAKKIRSRQSLAKTRLIAYMLSSFRLHVNGTVASIVFSKKILEETGARRSDTKNIVSMLRDIVNVKVSFMFLEEKNSFKVSLRSDGDIDVSNIALNYNGGGHQGAAGFNIEKSSLETIQKNVIERIKMETIK